MKKSDVARIRRTVLRYYNTHGRHDLPWRLTTDPYRILVSEVMLQQTQVARVVPKYEAFIRRFSDVHVLAQASLRDVLVAWQGLGYNRRAKMLHEAAKVVVSTYKGRMPHTYEELVKLPGVGPYTARAVCAFAYNEPGGMVETNIRTVLFHHWFTSRAEVADSEILQLTVVLCPKDKAREWYWAMMDYGAYLKEQGVRVNAKSKHYAKQSKFDGSDRQIRGAILRLLAREGTLTERVVVQNVDAAPGRVRAQLKRLGEEHLVRRTGVTWSI